MKLSQHSKSGLQVALQIVALMALFVAIAATVPANLTRVDSTVAQVEQSTVTLQA